MGRRCRTTAVIRLNALLDPGRITSPLDPNPGPRFETYLSLILRWNARINLTAIRDEDGILSRHFVESIACARALPAGIATLLDFGSGAGFPGIPIALCRPEIAVTLAESKSKKAAFLQEAIRILGITAKVHSQRAELLPARFDCVTLRAVDRMELAVQAAAISLVRSRRLAGADDFTRTKLPAFKLRPVVPSPGQCGSTSRQHRPPACPRRAAAGNLLNHRQQARIHPPTQKS